MSELALLLLLQFDASPARSDALRFMAITTAAMLVIIVATYLIFRGLRKQTDASVKAQLDAEFAKTKDALLLAAAQKQQAKDADEAAKREQSAEIKERELLRENVDPSRVFGQDDPLSGLEMMEDMELIIDPYTGQGYLLPSFLNDWPAGQERPKYIYRHPQGTVVKTTDLIGAY